MDTHNVHRSMGTYTFTNGQIQIVWRSNDREQGTVVWNSQNEFRYHITSHTDPNQVGLDVVFTAGDPPLPELPQQQSTAPGNSGPEVFTSMTASHIETIVSNFSDVKNFKEIDNNTYRFEVDGLIILLNNKDETLHLEALFNGTTSVSRINEWNRKTRFTQAYLNNSDEPVLDSDFSLDGGVTEENVKHWMKTYVMALSLFKTHISQ